MYLKNKAPFLIALRGYGSQPARYRAIIGTRLTASQWALCFLSFTNDPSHQRSRRLLLRDVANSLSNTNQPKKRRSNSHSSSSSSQSRRQRLSECGLGPSSTATLHHQRPLTPRRHQYPRRRHNLAGTEPNFLCSLLSELPLSNIYDPIRHI